MFDPTTHIRLLRARFVPVKNLGGFQKHHRIPQSDGPIELKLLHTVSQPDLDSDLETVFGKLRNEFSFKRRDLAVSDVEDGRGGIDTPFFNYEVSVAFDESNPATACFLRAITHINEPQQLFGEPFERVFETQFNMLEVIAPEPIDIEAVIDVIEAADANNVLLNYDKDATWCEITLTDSQASVRADANSICVSAPSGTSPHALFETFLKVKKHFEEALDFGCEGWQ